MSYVNASVSPADRAKALTTVIGIHALIGAGLVAGLAVTTIITSEAPPIEAEDIEIELDPIEPEVIEQQPVEQPRDTPYRPDTSFELDSDTRIDVTNQLPDPGPTVFDPGTLDFPMPTPTPAPRVTPSPSPSPTIAAVAARPTNGPGGWITTDDYPRRDLARGNEGTGSYRLVIGSDGRVDACEMTRSTGHSGLDRQTCRVIERIARFTPATDTTGARVLGTYTGTVTWQIPE